MLDTILLSLKFADNSNKLKFIMDISIKPNSIIFEPYRIHDRIPDNFSGYELNIIDEWLDQKSRLGKLLVYQPTKSSLTQNKIKLHESIYSFNFKTTHLNVKDVIVSGYAVFGRNNDLISINTVDKSPIVFPLEILEGSYDTAIALTHYILGMSAIFNNFMWPLYAIPMNIINRSVFIIPYSSFVEINKNFFNLFFPNNKIIVLDSQQFVFVKDFHTVIDPAPGIQHYAHGIIHWVKYMKKVLNISNIKSDYFGYSNRNIKYGRSIKNFDNLVQLIENTFIGKKWILVSDDYQNFSSAFKVYSSLKVILTIVGSNALPIVFMNEGSGVFFVSTMRYDWECVAYTTAVDLWCYYYAVPKFLHFNNKIPIDVDTNLIVDLLGDLIYAVENKKWPEKALDINKNFERKFTEFPG